MNKEEAKMSRVTPPVAALPKSAKPPTIEVAGERWVLDGTVEISRSFDVDTIRHPRS